MDNRSVYRNFEGELQPIQRDARAAIEDHTGSDISSINHAQRILLIEEDFDPGLLIGAEWLHESFSVDIRCYRLQAATAWVSWDAALEAVDNVALTDFVPAELAKHQESLLPHREVIYRMGGGSRRRHSALPPARPDGMPD